MRKLLVATGLAGAVFASGTAAAATPDQFTLRSTSDLLAVCQESATDNVSSASIGFCHGFLVGTYRVMEIVQEAKPQSARMFCPAATMPNRTEAIDAFVKWAAARPGELSKAPTESVADYLAVTYPCPAASGASSRRSAR